MIFEMGKISKLIDMDRDGGDIAFVQKKDVAFLMFIAATPLASEPKIVVALGVEPFVMVVRPEAHSLLCILAALDGKSLVLGKVDIEECPFRHGMS